MKLPMRERLLDACWDIVLQEGFAAATTKNIALKAGVAEGSIYRHFPDKTDLMIALVLERVGNVKSTLRTLHDAAGKESLKGNLIAVLSRLFGFYERLQRVSSGLLLDTVTMARMHATLAETGKGPMKAHQAIAGYLDLERQMGRLDDPRSSTILAMLLLGALHEQTFINAMTGQPFGEDMRETFVAEIVSAIFQD